MMMMMMMMRTTMQIPQAVLLLLLLVAMVKADLRGASSSSSSSSGAIGQIQVDELLHVHSIVSGEDAHPEHRFLPAKPGLSTNDVLDGPGDHGDKPSKKDKKSKKGNEGPTPSEEGDREYATTTTTTTTGDESGSGSEISIRQSSGLGGKVGRVPVNTAKFEFVLVRDAVGTADSDATFGVGSSLGIKGHIAEMIRNADGTFSHGDASVGFFRGTCTVVSRTKGERLCSYEVSLSKSFLPEPHKTDHEMGAVIVTGPVLDGGVTNTLIVTAAEFQFQSFQGGTLKTKADAKLPILFAWLDLAAY